MTLPTDGSEEREDVSFLGLDEVAVSRRSVLGGLLAGFALAIQSSCSGNGLNRTIDSTPSSLDAADVSKRRQLRTLQRLTFAPTAASLQRLQQLGEDAWLAEQLGAALPERAALTDALASIQSMVDPLASPATPTTGAAGLRRQTFAAAVAARSTLMAAFSENQLREVMVDIWADHLHVTSTAQPEVFLVYAYDQLLREHALGNYRDLLLATAKSRAMLVYLDQAKSRADAGHVPNENYARELLELHTLGVDGGYEERDVLAVAYLLSGWSSDANGEFVFRRARHSLGPAAGAKILGYRVQGNGVADGEAFIAHLAGHEQTAARVAGKIARRLVSEHLELTDELVVSAARVYLDSDTSIAAVVTHLVNSAEFAASDTEMFRRPLSHLAAVLRTSASLVPGFTAESAQLLRGAQQAMGQFVYGWPSPDGYPTGSAAWSNSGALITRWNTTYALFQANIPGVEFTPPPSNGAEGDPTDTSSSLIAQMLPRGGSDQLAETVGRVLATAPDPSAPDVATLAAARTVVAASPQFELV
jgi:uncharacterized protein (DUF1800 family)